MPLPHEDAFSMTGKVVIITGAAGNVGSGIADVFAANKANVIMSDLPGEKLTMAAENLRKSCPSVFETPANLTEPQQLKALVDQTVQRFGRLDAIVNCGGLPGSTVITEEDVPDFDRLYHTNVRSIWLLTKYAIEPMAANGGGSIVSISSINGHRPTFFCSLYASTKAAVLVMTQELAVELAPHNIRVNTVSPGMIANTSARTAWLVSLLHEPYASEFKAQFEPVAETATMTAQPLKMVGHGHDIGMACYYLCTPAARFVTGEDIRVDGGKMLEMHEAEPRLRQGQPSFWHSLRQHVTALPDEAWKGEKPKWLQRQKAKA